MPDLSSNNNMNNKGEAEDEEDMLIVSESGGELSREEVLRRRSRRLKRLKRIYKDHYWSLIEQLKSSHRDYYWAQGKYPYHHPHPGDCDINSTNICVDQRCKANGCKSKAMALTRFCLSHILADPNQVLYKGCSFATKSSQAGPVLCMKPILRSTVPSICPLHIEKAEKSLRMALKKGGYHSATTATKIAPKSNVLIAESVRLIQSRRRAAQRAMLLDTAKTKERH